MRRASFAGTKFGGGGKARALRINSTASPRRRLRSLNPKNYYFEEFLKNI